MIDKLIATTIAGALVVTPACQDVNSDPNTNDSINSQYGKTTNSAPLDPGAVTEDLNLYAKRANDLYSRTNINIIDSLVTQDGKVIKQPNIDPTKTIDSLTSFLSDPTATYTLFYPPELSGGYVERVDVDGNRIIVAVDEYLIGIFKMSLDDDDESL